MRDLFAIHEPRKVKDVLIFSAIRWSASLDLVLRTTEPEPPPNSSVMDVKAPRPRTEVRTCLIEELAVAMVSRSR